MKANAIKRGQRVRVAGGTGLTDRIWTVANIDGRQVEIRDDNDAVRLVDCGRVRAAGAKP